MRNKEITYEVKEELGILSEVKSGWKLEVNILSWNGKDDQLDIRPWSPDKKTMGKGIALTKEEEKNLYEILKKRNEEN